VPHLVTCIFFYNEPELGVRIDPGMALTPLPFSIGRGLNPRPSDREPSALQLVQLLLHTTGSWGVGVGSGKFQTFAHYLKF